MIFFKVGDRVSVSGIISDRKHLTTCQGVVRFVGNVDFVDDDNKLASLLFPNPNGYFQSILFYNQMVWRRTWWTFRPTWWHCWRHPLLRCQCWPWHFCYRVEINQNIKGDSRWFKSIRSETIKTWHHWNYSSSFQWSLGCPLPTTWPHRKAQTLVWISTPSLSRPTTFQPRRTSLNKLLWEGHYQCSTGNKRR